MTNERLAEKFAGFDSFDERIKRGNNKASQLTIF